MQKSECEKATMNSVNVVLILAAVSSTLSLISAGPLLSNKICINDMCNSTINYPEAKILRALSKQKGFASMFGTITAPAIKISNRFSFGQSNMCPTTEITYSPRIGKNVDGEQRFIVNIDGHTQMVHSKVCATDAKCFENGVRSGENIFECQTQHVVVRLVVFKTNGKLDVEHFPIPAGCFCSFKPNTDFNGCNNV